MNLNRFCTLLSMMALLWAPFSHASTIPDDLSEGETVKVCAHINQTGVSDILKSAMVLRASLPLVPASEEALLQSHGRRSTAATSPVARSRYFIAWKLEQQIDQAIEVLGRVPASDGHDTPIGRRINQANEAISHLTAAMALLAYAAVDNLQSANSATPAVLTSARIRDRTHELENLSLDMNVLISCGLMVP